MERDADNATITWRNDGPLGRAELLPKRLQLERWIRSFDVAYYLVCIGRQVMLQGIRRFIVLFFINVLFIWSTSLDTRQSTMVDRGII